jgi:hypothetical protein
VRLASCASDIFISGPLVSPRLICVLWDLPGRETALFSVFADVLDHVFRPCGGLRSIASMSRPGPCNFHPPRSASASCPPAGAPGPTPSGRLALRI